MGRRAHRLSIFSQSLDRTAFLVYLMGAVVPLAALGYVVQGFVLPVLPEGPWTIGLIALVISIGALSVASFFALRRVTWQTIERMGRDNRRLAALLETSSALATAAHGSEVAARVASCALRLTSADGAFFVTGRGTDGTPKLEASAGEAKLVDALTPKLPDILEQVLGENRPTLWRAGQLGSRNETIGTLHCAAIPVDDLGALLTAARHSSEAMELSDLGSLETLAALASVATRSARLRDAQRNFFVHVTDLLVASLDVHTDVQSGHSRRVADLANRIGRALGLDDDRRQRLHFAALLHDVGMLRISPQRLGEPKAYRQHPLLGFKMLAPIELWEDIAPLVLHHHEWYDGGGYPEGISGDDIPLESRIIGLAEAYDSMTSVSSYKQPVPVEEARRRVEEASGTQFDPDVVRCFLGLDQPLD